MVANHWGLRKEPFGRRELELAACEGPSAEALARLQFLYDNHALGGLLAAPPGCGKTAVLKYFARLTRDSGSPTAYVAACEADERFLLTTLLRGWAIHAREDRDCPPNSLWRRIGDQLQTWRIDDCRPVILLDDLDDAPQLRGPVDRLIGLAIAARAPLLVVVSSRPETAPSLGSRLLGALELRIDLHPWDVAATDQFLTQRLADEGRTNPVFTPPAVQRLQALSGGAPRQVSLLAELSLVAGAAAGQTAIDGGTVETVFRELASLESAPTLEAVLR